jgi:hypothetical protein
MPFAVPCPSCREPIPVVVANRRSGGQVQCPGCGALTALPVAPLAPKPANPFAVERPAETKSEPEPWAKVWRPYQSPAGFQVSAPADGRTAPGNVPFGRPVGANDQYLAEEGGVPYAAGHADLRPGGPVSPADLLIADAAARQSRS